MKVEMDMYYLIRSYHNDGMSIRAIAKTLGISRQTVKKYCAGTTIPGNRKEYHRDSTIITDETREFMFDHFGGVPNRLIFDNAKVAVREGFGKHAIATDGYAAFAAHYAFQTDFCNIASGNEKGLVENLVGYSRRNFMVPVPKAKSLEELNAKLIEYCLNYRKEVRSLDFMPLFLHS